MQIRKKEIKAFTDDRTVYIEYVKESIRKKKHGQVNEFSKVTKYKKNIQKSSIFLYTGSEYVNTKIKNSIPSPIAQKYNAYM